MTTLDEIREALADPSTRVVVLTGAGISAAAGLPTYRGPGGMYPAGVIPLHATDARSKNLAALWERLLPLAEGARAATPTPAHLALAALANTTVITQNVDGLHETAGSPDVLAMHGTLARVRCSQPGAGHYYDLPEVEAFDDDVPRCTIDNSRLRPDVVLFGEQLAPATVSAAVNAAEAADVALAVGTSLQVHPVAGVLTHALNSGAIGAWLDMDPARALNRVHATDYGSFHRLLGVPGDVQITVPDLLGSVGGDR